MSGTILPRALSRAARATRIDFEPRPIQHIKALHKSARIPAITSSQSRHRPTVVNSQQRSAPPSIAPSSRSIFIQTQDTPNADALKFIPNHQVLPEGFPSSFVEYTSPRSTLAPPHPSQLASRLLNVDGVSSVFYGSDFITVTKAGDVNWAHIKPEVFSLITEAVTAGEPMVAISEKGAGSDGQAVEEDSLTINDEDDEVVAMIKELLETRIRPAIQEDGGDIDFRGFENGMVNLKLRGACRTCDSSTVTLKNGIESMLMHYVSLFPLAAIAELTHSDRGSQRC
jgi:NFU1 iron-sulfur cluster scaffold homolog, mitochondrial